MKKRLESELAGIFPPEFRGRIDETVVFSRLTPTDIQKIAENMLSETAERLKKQGTEIVFPAEVYELLGKKGCDKVYGARNLRSLIVREVETPLSELLISENPPERITCSVKGEEICFYPSEEALLTAD